MLHDELAELLEPAWERVRDHSYFDGLRHGWLPDPVLVHFCEQDSAYLLPGYARALARCAAYPGDEARSSLLGHWVTGALDTRSRMIADFAELADELVLPVSNAPRPAPATCNYMSFLTASAATSLAAGLGAALPSAMMHTRINADLQQRHVAGSRFSTWIHAAQPGQGYAKVVDELIECADQFLTESSESARTELLEHFRGGAYHEWAFVESAWRLHGFPF